MISRFVITDFIDNKKKQELETKPYNSQYNFIGGVWNDNKDPQPEYLHEIELGLMDWSGDRFVATRIRLFSYLGMTSYYIVFGNF